MRENNYRFYALLENSCKLTLKHHTLSRSPAAQLINTQFGSYTIHHVS